MILLSSAGTGPSEAGAPHEPGCSFETTLDRVPLGREVMVCRLRMGGFLRRRLLDLGFVSGAQVLPVRRSPFGDPTAYEIKGTLVALRDSEACDVIVSWPEHGEGHGAACGRKCPIYSDVESCPWLTGGAHSDCGGCEGRGGA